jgi:hypothetical protein
MGFGLAAKLIVGAAFLIEEREMNEFLNKFH